MNGVIYARYSSESQREESIEGQLRECRAYAERMGIRIVDTYEDRALTGKTDKRPSFLRMMSDSKKRLFDVVIVWKFDRFSRNEYDFVTRTFELEKNGVKLLSATEQIPDGPGGTLIMGVYRSMSAYYSEELAEKIHRGQTENALKSKYNGGNLPFGFAINESHDYQINPVTAPIVRELFQRYADGESAQSIINDLNARGIRTTRGNEFTQSNLNTMLKNRHYIGEYHYRDVVTPDAIPAIVEKEVFEHVQTRLEKNRRAPGRAKAKERYILTTKLFCGHCGAFMAGESGTSRTGSVHHYYKCGNAKRRKGCHKKSIRKAFIEQFVILRTKQKVLTDENIDFMANEVLKFQQRENTALPVLQKELKDVEKAINNLITALEKGIFSESTKARLDNLEARKETLKISILKEEICKPTLTKEQIVFWISRFKDGDVNDIQYQQELIDCFVNAIYLFDDHIKVIFNCKDNAETVTLQEVEASFSGSDFVGYAPPK